MARKPRVHFPGAVYHVILRGNAGQDVFVDGDDRCRFYLLLQEGTARFGYRVHGFCLMTNHIHLALQVGEIPLSRGMQNVGFRYTRWFNQRRSRSGHLFQGRYKAVLVEQESYLLELVRYIHLNSVRAGMVCDAADYPWSSHRAYLGDETIPWLTTEWVLGQFSRRLATARKQYDAFIRGEMDKDRREEFQRGSKMDPRILGSDTFVEEIMAREGMPAQPPTLASVATVVSKEYDLDGSRLAAPDQYRRPSEARAMLGWLAREVGAAGLTEVAEFCRRDVSSISSAVRRLEVRSKEDRVLQRRMECLRSM